MYAVISSGGKQYRVGTGDVLRLEKLSAAAGAQVEFGIVALRNDEGEMLPGTGARVTGTVINHGKGAKILVFHYKRKKQFKKLQGHRQQFSTVRVDTIQLPS